MSDYRNREDAEAALLLEGWQRCQKPHTDYFWKRSKPDPFYGDAFRTYLATVDEWVSGFVIKYC